MKNKLEQKLDAELGRMGVKIHTYHLRSHVWPFTGVTIIIADREWTYMTVKIMMQKEISMYTLNTATETKKNLNAMGIYGVALCNIRDQYSKKRGRIIAKGRLLKHLKEMMK
jgi:hypothetical protein